MRYLVTYCSEYRMAFNSGLAESSNLLPVLKDMGFDEPRIETCLKVLSTTSNGIPVSLEAAVEW